MPTEIFIPCLIFPVDSCCFASAAFHFCRMFCGKVLSPTDDFGEGEGIELWSMVGGIRVVGRS